MVRQPRQPMAERRLVRLTNLVADDRRRSLEEAHEIGEVVQETEYQIISRGVLTRVLPEIEKIAEGMERKALDKDGELVEVAPAAAEQIAAFNAIAKAKDGAVKAQQVDQPQGQGNTTYNFNFMAPDEARAIIERRLGVKRPRMIEVEPEKDG